MDDPGTQDNNASMVGTTPLETGTIDHNPKDMEQASMIIEASKE